MRHNATHHIRTTPSPPVACRPYCLTPDCLAMATAEFDAMPPVGTARRAEGPWLSALHLVPKKDSGWRPCGDYRALNARTIPDRHPIPHIQHYSHRLSGCTTFSTIDVVGLTTRFLFTLISRRLQSPQLSAFSNFPLCPLAHETLPKPSVSWTISLKTWISALPTLTTSFSLAVPQGTRPTRLHPLQSTLKLRHPSKPVQVCFPCSRNFLPQTQSHPWVPSPFLNVLLIFNPAPLPRPSAKSVISWEY